MIERQRIVRLWHEGAARVLVTVIRVEGSSYRRPGARLLLGEAGVYAGAISGGCLEAEVMRRAAWKVRDGAVVERYSTLFDDTAEIPYGLGCGGVVDLLLEPAGTPECAALIAAMECSLRGEASTVVTWLPGEGKKLRRAVLDAAGETVFASEGLAEKKLACAASLVPGEEYEGRFVERLEGPQRFFIIGAGDDAQPVAAMASMMGWRVTVADGRKQLARRERFAEADEVICASDEKILGVRADDAVVIMSHSYEQDRDALTALLPVAPRYLGLLGARHRSALLLHEAAQALGLEVAVCCERVWAPVGLDLGGEGPGAIALAIVAEAQAACMGRLGVSRRLSAADVALYVSEGDHQRYLERQCAADTA